VIQPASIEQRFDEGDAGALPMGREIAAQRRLANSPAVRGRRGRREPGPPPKAHRWSRGAPARIRRASGRAAGPSGLVVGDDALRAANSLAEGLLRDAGSFSHVREATPEAAAGKRTVFAGRTASIEAC